MSLFFVVYKTLNKATAIFDFPIEFKVFQKIYLIFSISIQKYAKKQSFNYTRVEKLPLYLNCLLK